MEVMNSITSMPDYIAVVSKYPPKIIRSEEENEYCTSLLYDLDQRSEQLTDAESEFAELLTLLIEDFESKHYDLPSATPIEVLTFLMDQHGLKQRDLLDIFGSPSVTSEVLSGKRELSKEHIRRLVARFQISADVLL